jgi:hypothetical protein
LAKIVPDDFRETLHRRPRAKSVVFARYVLAMALRAPGRQKRPLLLRAPVFSQPPGD